MIPARIASPAPVVSSTSTGNGVNEAGLIGYIRVVRLPCIQATRIIGEHMAEVCGCVRAGKSEPTHVAHIEQPGATSGDKVLRDRAFVLDGHFPSLEVHNRGIVAHMPFVKRGVPLVQYWFCHRVLSSRDVGGTRSL